MTTSRKLEVAVATPSPTVTVTKAAPLAFAAGVRVTTRSVPVPPRTMPAAGSSAGFDDDAVTVNASAAVSASCTRNLIGPVLPSSRMIRGVIREIVGTASTLRTNVSVAVAAPSPTVRVMVQCRAGSVAAGG